MIIIGKRTKEGFVTVERIGNPDDLDPGPLAEILLERLLKEEAGGDLREKNTALGESAG